jgi:hypothetical protein
VRPVAEEEPYVEPTDRAGAALAIVLAACLSACASVEPWERGHLARPHMALDPHPACNALHNHVHASREAASGGESAGVDGCGCY